MYKVIIFRTVTPKSPFISQNTNSYYLNITINNLHVINAFRLEGVAGDVIPILIQGSIKGRLCC